MPSTSEDPCGLVVSRLVGQSSVAPFEAALRDMLAFAARMPGYVSSDVLREPAGPDRRAYHIIYRFEAPSLLDAWKALPEYRAMVRHFDTLALSPARHRLTGLEGWFDIEPGHMPPPRPRMALVTWIGIWPVVSLALWALASPLGGLPFLARTGITTAVVVLVMTYLVMPRLARLAAGFLYR